MRFKPFLKRLHIAILHWKLRRVEVQRRRAVADLIWAVDFRWHAIREFFARGKHIAARKAALQQQLDSITKEMA